MRLSELEAWVLNVISAVERRQPVEDARVELKAEWPPPEKAARRIAGHANAAGGEWVLWIIGVDEDKGVIGVKKEELADWHSALVSYFDSVTPELTDLLVPTPSGQVLALLFNGERVPYVVRNPAYGQKGSGPVEFEVPWRRGTAVRTARRSDLVQILDLVAVLPEVEVLSGHLDLLEKPDKHGKWHLCVYLRTYIIPKGQSQLVIPFHRCVVELEVGDQRVDSTRFQINPPQRGNIRDQYSDSLTIESSGGELIAQGPGKAIIEAAFELDERPSDEIQMATVRSRLGIVGSSAPLVVNADLTRDSEDRRWSWAASS